MDVLETLRETFFDLDAMREALPDLITVGLPNTLLLAVVSAIIGTILGMALAVAGLSRHRWLRWPARVWTDVFRGLPAAVTILLIGVAGLVVAALDQYARDTSSVHTLDLLLNWVVPIAIIWFMVKFTISYPDRAREGVRDGAAQHASS